MRKTWTQKLDNGRDPKVVILSQPFCGVQAGSRLLVGTPRLVKEYIDSIPPGERVTVAAMRNDLAAQWNADAMCPVSTGIFVRIVAEAALEELARGTPESAITPFWRIVDETSPVASKLSCGAAFIGRMQASEHMHAPSNR